MQPDATMEFI